MYRVSCRKDDSICGIDQLGSVCFCMLVRAVWCRGWAGAVCGMCSWELLGHSASYSMHAVSVRVLDICDWGIELFAMQAEVRCRIVWAVERSRTVCVVCSRVFLECCGQLCVLAVREWDNNCS